jgi:hypothetical protein
MLKLVDELFDEDSFSSEVLLTKKDILLSAV